MENTMKSFEEVRDMMLENIMKAVTDNSEDESMKYLAVATALGAVIDLEADDVYTLYDAQMTLRYVLNME